MILTGTQPDRPRKDRTRRDRRQPERENARAPRNPAPHASPPRERGTRSGAVFTLALTAWIAGSLALAAPVRADGYVLFVDDRGGFESTLGPGAVSVIDSDGMFAPDPTVLGSVPAIERAGLLGGLQFVYRAYDVDFAAAPPGTLSPGQVGGDIADLDSVIVESPAAQSGAVGAGSWGLDGGTGSSATRNALLVDFTVTPDGAGVGHFALDLLDFETGAGFTPGALRLYADGLLVHAFDFDWGSADGNGETHFLGVLADGPGAVSFDQVAVVVGDDSDGGGRRERWAADRFTFGPPSDVQVATPEPGSAALLTLGLLGLAAGRGRRQTGRARSSSTGGATRSPRR